MFILCIFGTWLAFFGLGIFFGVYRERLAWSNT